MRGCPACYYTAGSYYYRTYFFMLLGREHRCQSCGEMAGDPNSKTINLTGITGTARLLVDEGTWSRPPPDVIASSNGTWDATPVDGEGKNLTMEFSQDVVKLLLLGVDPSLQLPPDTVLVLNMSHDLDPQSLAPSTYALQFQWLILALNNDEDELLQEAQVCPIS